MRGFGAIAFLAAAGCSSAEIYLPTPWDSDLSLVVLTANSEFTPIGEPLVVDPKKAIRLDVERGAEVRIHVLEFPPDRRIDECGVMFGGDHLLLGAPSRGWVAPANDYADGDAPVFVEDATGARATFDLRYDRCTPASAECARFQPEPFRTNHQADYGIEAILPVSDTSVFYQLDASEVDVQPINLFLHTFGPSPDDRMVDTGTVTGSVKGLAFDGERVYGVTDDQIRFTMTPTGELLSQSTFTQNYVRVAAIPGLVIEYGRDGAHTLEGSLPPLDESVTRLALIRPDRIAALTSSAIYYFGGSEWKREAAIRFNAENWSGIGGDDDILLAVNEGGDVLVRDEARGIWEHRETPFGFRRFYSAVGLGGGAYLVTADDGLLVLSVNGEFCGIEPGEVNNLPRSALSPSRRTLFVGSVDVPAVRSDDPLLYRIPIPERN